MCNHNIFMFKHHIQGLTKTRSCCSTDSYHVVLPRARMTNTGVIARGKFTHKNDLTLDLDVIKNVKVIVEISSFVFIL